MKKTATKTLGKKKPEEAAAPEVKKTLGRGAKAEDAVSSEPVRAQRAKTLGRAQGVEVEAPVSKPAKSLGRALSSGGSASKVVSLREAGKPSKGPKSGGGPTRALVRQKVAERLSGKLSAAALGAWAKQQYLAFQGGGASDELIEETLQQLSLAAVAPVLVSDDKLVEMMTQLE